MHSHSSISTALLVYLTARTWTSGEASAAFADEVGRALVSGVRLLLAHEMPGAGQEGRHATEFATMFACADGTTPPRLLKRGIYNTIATPLKGGDWRKASMVMLAQALAEEKELPASAAAPPAEHEARRGGPSPRASPKVKRTRDDANLGEAV